MFYVYVVYNRNSNKIYIGQTDDLLKRVKEHNDSNNKTHAFTQRFLGNWELIYKEELKTRQEAKTRERQLKSYRGREYIKNLIPCSSVGRAPAC